MAETELIWGPPGTGKTTSLIGRVEDELARGVEPDRIGYFSFTRAAANEAKKRAMLKFPAIKQERLVHYRTLHSEAFRLLHWTRDKMMAGKHLREFSKQWHYDISDPNFQDDNIEDHEMREGVFRSLGDWLLHFHSWRHNLMMGIEEAFSQFCYRNEPPMAEWSLDQTTLFESRYEEFKKAKGLLDFDDLIEVCLDQGLRPNLDVLVLDEAQDSSPLQYKFLDQLLIDVKRHYIGGDPNQAIYGFMGTDPSLFTGRRRDKETLLEQSHRLPRRVHQLATQIVPCPTYFPRDEEGMVEIASLGATIEDVDLYPGTIFILVRNRYVLDQVIRTLYSYGLPFDNLRGKAPFKGTTAQKLLHMRKLLRGEKINVGELHQLIDKITPQTKYFVRGFKSQIRGLHRDTPYLSITLNTIRDKLLPAFLGDPFQTLDINDERKAYFIRVIKRYGEKVLLDTPRTLIGTIHCSPPDELVLLANGFQKAIGEVNPDWDHLVTFEESSNSMELPGQGPRSGRRKRGAAFQKTEHFYEGDLIVMETSRSRCRVTPDHWVRVRFADSFYNKWVAYLMRRGDWWRIGISKSAQRPYRSGSVPGRLASEKADAAWLLGVYQTEREARIAEAQLQARYGLPGLTFEIINRNRIFTVEDLHFVHEATKGYLAPRVETLFADFGFYMDNPLYIRTSETGRKYMSNCWFETVAANVLDGMMEVPVWDKSLPPTTRTVPDSEIVRVSRQYYRGPVVGLEVPPYGYYVSGGQVVHNSVKGMEADWVAVMSEMSRRTFEGAERLPEEEARVWYVGATRARQGLFLVPAPEGRYEWQWPTW